MLTTPIYDAGFDPGSAEATLFLRSADGIEPGANLLSIPSFIADGWKPSQKTWDDLETARASSGCLSAFCPDLTSR